VYNTPQKLAAEFIGTFALVFFASGAICADQFLHGNGGGGLLGIALAYGLAFGVMICSIGHISGGHFNPAVTIAFWVTKRLNTLEVFGYWLAQILGGIAAAFFLKTLLPREDAWLPVLGGAPDLARDFTRLPAIGLEAVATFFLVFVFFAAAVDEESSARPYAGLCIGISVMLGVLAIGPFTGAALSPARAFGPALASSHWNNQGVYWVGPLAGGFFAGLLHDVLFGKKTGVEA
jgi:MIP family channel proteins